MTNIEKRIDVGACRASIFTTEISTGSGKVPIKNVTLVRLFTGRDGEARTAYSFRANDLPKAILALARAYEHIIATDGERTGALVKDDNANLRDWTKSAS